jgi:quinol monooxygenase YgiN
MLVVAGTIDVEPAQRQAFLEGRRDAVQASRGEPGCIEYAFSADLLDPGRVRIFERWESAEHLDAHLARADGGAASDVPILAAELLRYEIGGVGPLMG